MPSYDTLKKKQTELIRKALDGSVFLAKSSAEAPVTLTEATGVAPNQVIALKALPTGYEDLGLLTKDGASFGRDVSSSTVGSWGQVTPTRTDVTSDITTLTCTAQETKLLTIGLVTGADLSAAVPDTGTGEIRVAKPQRPKQRTYRALSIAVDQTDDGELYIARFLPKARPTTFAEQPFNDGDEAIPWGVTLTGEYDSDLGYSESWFFGGPGWLALLEDMGFPAPV